MKSILTGILMLLFSIAIGQTDLSTAEYYIDHDPGYGNATPIAISGDTALIYEIISNSLELGFHTFYMRAKDDLGNWGMDEATPFKIIEAFVPQEFYQIDYVEYYINHDPGYGNATEIAVTTGDTLLISEIISNDLNPGFNTLFIRGRNANNQWGMDEAFTFYVQEDYTVNLGSSDPIVGFEYFIDNDPGNGNGILINLSPGDSIQIHEWLESQVLSDGIHQLSIRVKSDSGIWGLTEWTTFEYLNCEDATVNITSSETDFCENDSLFIEGPSGFDLYSWNNHKSDSQMYATSEGDYYASVYDSIANQCFLSDTLTAILLDAPNSSFDYSTSFSTITAQAIYPDQNFFWQINDEFSSVESTISYTFDNDGWQSICLETSNICGVEEFCDTVLLCSNFETPPYFYVDNDGDGFGVASDSIRACSAPSGFADNALDCDDNDDSINPGADEIPDDGIDQNCDGEDLVTGINELEANGFSFFPNPASSYLTVTLEDVHSGRIEIIDMRGRIIQSWTLDNENESILDVNQLTPGLYFIQLISNENKTVKPLVIQ